MRSSEKLAEENFCKLFIENVLNAGLCWEFSLHSSRRNFHVVYTWFMYTLCDFQIEMLFICILQLELVLLFCFISFYGHWPLINLAFWTFLYANLSLVSIWIYIYIYICQLCLLHTFCPFPFSLLLKCNFDFSTLFQHTLCTCWHRTSFPLVFWGVAENTAVARPFFIPPLHPLDKQSANCSSSIK